MWTLLFLQAVWPEPAEDLPGFPPPFAALGLTREGLVAKSDLIPQLATEISVY